MTHDKTGGPAFPDPSLADPQYLPSTDRSGMTLRDWFAGQALAGLVGGYTANSDLGGLSPGMMADEAYQYADAMIAERTKSDTGDTQCR